MHTKYIFLGLCGRKVGRSFCFCGIRTLLQGGCWWRVSFMTDLSLSQSLIHLIDGVQTVVIH